MYSKELKFIKEKVITTYKEMINTPLTIEDKGDFDTITNIDLAVEKALIKAIKESYPFDSIISEEYNPEGKVKGRTWIIDPIDGTVNFSRNAYNFGIQIAFFDNNEVVLSYMYFPRLNDEYYALKGLGAYRNGEKIVRKVTPLKQTIMSFSDFFVNDDVANSFQERLFLNLKDKLFRTRIIGSSAVDFASLAIGYTDALVMRTTNIWDLAPGYLLAKESGCSVTNEKGTTYSFTDYALFAYINPQFGNILKEALPK